MLIHTISFVLVSVDSSELCGRDAVSENFISIGFSRVLSAASEVFLLCQETILGGMLIHSLYSEKVCSGIHESGHLDPVMSDCGCKVLEPQNLLHIPASHISLNPLLKSSPLPHIL